RIAPMHDRHHDRIEVEPLLGEDVFMALRRFLIGNAAQDAGPDQLLQPFRQQVARDAERRLKSFEASGAQETFAKDQKRPAVADHADRPRYRARLFFEGIPLHSALHLPPTPAAADSILIRYLR